MEAESYPDIEELTRFAVDVIVDLGKEAVPFYGRGKLNVKFDEELVTSADLHLTKCFTDALHAKYPSHQHFNNNEETITYTHEDKRYLWIHDPVDGVANFQTGIPIWGMSLALLENFWPIFGVFHMPITGDLFHAQAAQPAFLGNQKLHVADQRPIDDESLLLTFSRFHRQYVSTFPGKIRDLGCTTAHICYVAMGRADAAFIANESYQGLAAARVIIESAGGSIFAMDGSGFFLNDYLNGEKIEEHLLVVPPENFSPVSSCLKKIV